MFNICILCYEFQEEDYMEDLRRRLARVHKEVQVDVMTTAISEFNYALRY